MEMFAAIYPAPTSETRPGQLNTNFFSEASTDILDEEGSTQTIFYERTPSVLQVQQEMFVGNKKPTLPLNSIYNLQPEKYKELNERLVNSEVQVPFIIKWYGSEENQKENHIQINSFVEVTGFLYSSNPIQAESATEANETLTPIDMGVDGFEIDHYLNNYFAPSIHALSVNKLNPYDQTFASLSDLSAPSLEITNGLRDYFRKAALGDDIVGDLVLYSMLSYVTGRPQQYPIDCLCLNVYDVKTPQVVKNLSKLLALVTPYIASQPVTLKDLGCARWYGKKNYDLNCIDNGTLAIPNGGLILLDESKLETGKIHEVGVKNANFITDIIQNQKLYYDFDYFTFSAESNLTVISLSQGKSIFGFEYRIPIKISNSSMNEESEEMQMPSESELRRFQRAVMFVKTKAHEIEIGDELARHIEYDYVQQRKELPNFNQEMIKLSLSITKYATLLEAGADPQPSIALYQASKKYAVELVKRNDARAPPAAAQPGHQQQASSSAGRS